jgi:outer membrane protein TolC
VKFTIRDVRCASVRAAGVCGLTLGAAVLSGAEPESPQGKSETTDPQFIDLPTALQLAGANNLDVKIARERLAEAQASHLAARQKFFPWISPGFSYRRHDGQIQDVEGRILDTSKQSYTVGAMFSAQVELGPAWYQSLAARQRADAAAHQFETQKQLVALAAATGYFELARAQALVEVADEAVRLATEHEKQLGQAVEAGLAFKGDLLRVQVQTGRAQLALRQALESRRLAAARLAQVLRLDSTVALTAPRLDLAPVTLVPRDRALDSLVSEALQARPELREFAALVAAAEKDKDGAVYGPLVPELGAQVFAGGLGGGLNGDTGNFDATANYQILLGWRLGPGGLFDRARIRATESRLAASRLSLDKLRDEIVRQVVEAHTRVHSLADQIQTAQRALDAAEETFRLSRERKEFGVGAVLEDLQAEQELTRNRSDYLRVIADFNQAQFLLSGAVGTLLAPGNGSGHSRVGKP